MLLFKGKFGDDFGEVGHCQKGLGTRRPVCYYRVAGSKKQEPQREKKKFGCFHSHSVFSCKVTSNYRFILALIVYFSIQDDKSVLTREILYHNGSAAEFFGEQTGGLF